VLNKLMTPETRKLGKAFDMAGFEIRFVGGCVRDAILGVVPKDVDFCTDATPEEMRDVAKINKFGFIETGIAHGTATLVVDGEPFEVTTLRVDVDTDGRHAEVEFTRSFEVDAERRDLTINAMSMAFDGTVFDYFGGKEDLESRVVRFVGAAELRVREDFLRILRYFRFAARFDATMDQETLDLFQQPDVLDGLHKVSVERFWQEMSKLLDPNMPARVRVVDAIFKTGVNRALSLFRFDPVELARSDDAVAALSTLVQASEVGSFLRKWKLSKEEAEKVTFMVSHRDINLTDEAVEMMLTILNISRETVASLYEVRGEPTLAQYARDFVIPVFPVRGQDLLDMGMKPGIEFGQHLNLMKRAWTMSRWTMQKDELLAVIQK
jgi:tRNA nucleotidyltransferase (CCA-adding enzyme)